MKKKILESVRRCLEENGYSVREIAIAADFPSSDQEKEFDDAMINQIFNIKIRAEK